MASILESVEYYMKLGWPCIPLAPRAKKPNTAHGLAEGTTEIDTARQWFERHPNDNVGICTGGDSGLIVIDIDYDPVSGKDGYDALHEWEREHGELPETVTALTPRGGMHIYYRVKNADEYRNSVNEEKAIDIRATGGYVVAPPSILENGQYQWENHPEDYAVKTATKDVLAFIEWVAPKAKSGGIGEKFELPSKIKPGKRNDTLFRYACSLQAKGYGDAEIEVLVSHANETLCTPPVPSAELSKTIQSALDYEKGRIRAEDETDAEAAVGYGTIERYRKFVKSDSDYTGKLRHSVLGEDMIAVSKACKIDGMPAIFRNGIYECGWQPINDTMFDVVKDITTAEQREVRNFINSKAPQMDPSPPWLLAFENGVLDVRLGELIDYDPSMVITSKIPHRYVPDAKCPKVDEFLDNVACGDTSVRRNLEEIMGLCIYRSNEFGIVPVLTGKGSNGKSTFMKMLIEMVGRENVSTLQPKQLANNNFQAGMLAGKLANIADDISNQRLEADALAIIKKIGTGDPIYTDVKGKDGFTFTPYATMVISANEFPKLADSSEGMMRRLFCIPFKGYFAPGIPGYDPRIGNAIASKEGMERCIRLAVDGLKRVMLNNEMTPNTDAETARADIRTENSSILQWMDDCGISAESLEGRIIPDTYEDYKNWCAKAGIQKAYTKPNFTKNVNEMFGYESEARRIEFASGEKKARVFVKKER